MKIDLTTILIGAVALVALIGSIILAGLSADTGVIASLGAVVTTCISYLIGLHSDKPGEQ